MKSLSVHIPNPCHENWHKMSITKRGHHCSSCKKIVTDFTQMSDDEIIAFFGFSTENHCGRFRTSQIERPFFHEKKLAKKASFKWGMLMASWLLITTISCKTEHVLPQKEQTINLPDKNSMVKNVTTNGINILQGYVKDRTDKMPLAGAIIKVKNTQISTVANRWGQFELVFPENYAIKEATLVINYIGYVMQQIPCYKLKTGTPSFYLVEDNTMLGEVVVVGNINTKKER